MDAPIGQLMRSAGAGDADASGALFVALYRELHHIAERELRRGGSGLTLGTTTLLHEAYLNIAKREGVEFASRGQFLAYAARAMRGLILHHARDRHTLKRGGEFSFAPLDEAIETQALRSDDLERMGSALDELAAIEPRLAQIIDLKFFCGFSFEEIAGMWGISDRTVQRDWAKARIFLHGKLGRSAF